MSDDLEVLRARMASLTTKEERLEDLLSRMRTAATDTSNYKFEQWGASIQPLVANENKPRSNPTRTILQISKEYGIQEELIRKVNKIQLLEGPWGSSWSKPYKKRPCAGAIAKEQWKCGQTGTLVRSNCQLVAYCSPVRPKLRLLVNYSHFIQGMSAAPLAQAQNWFVLWRAGVTIITDGSK